MKKRLFVIGCVLVLGVGAIVVTAASHGGKGDMDGKCMMKMNSEGMCCHKDRCGKCMSMHGAMKHQSLVATSDGGVVLWLGKTLVKFDSSLNKVSEVELEMEAYCGEMMAAKRTSCCMSDKMACSNCGKADCKGGCWKK